MNLNRWNNDGHKSPLERFQANVLLGNRESDCWQWIGKKDRKGYGNFSFNGVDYRAHRFSYAHFVGEIPADKPQVLHKCDNPSCANPQHLFVGTAADNVADMVAKGRQPKGATHGFSKHPESIPNGEKNGRALLTEQDVLKIREMAKHKSMSRTEMAVFYSVSRETINAIITRRNWSHV